MVSYKEYIANQLLNKKVRFVCDCIIRLDITGIVSGYELSGNEIVYIIDTKNKQVKIGENTPKLKIQMIG